MNYPSDYQPTLRDPLPFYQPLDKNRDNVCALYGACIGVSYIGPYLFLPFYFKVGNEFLYWGMTQYAEIQNKANLLKQLPEGLRGGRPFFAENMDVLGFYDDRLVDSSQTSVLSFRGLTFVSKNAETRANLEIIGATGSMGSPWPTIGASVMREFMKSYCQELSKAGATIDFLMTDREFVQFRSLNSSQVSSITGNSQYYLPFGGSCSWDSQMQYLGLCYSDYKTLFEDDYLFYNGNWGWTKVAQNYNSEAMNLAYFNPAAEIYPDIITSNYDYYNGEQNRQDDPIDQNGFIWPQGGAAGNAGSPILYGRIRHLSQELSRGACIREDFPTHLWSWNIERRELYRRGPVALTSPSVSFLQGMLELKIAKKNALDKPLAPWINTIYVAGYDSEFHFISNNFVIGQNQSPPEVLHDHWYPVNIVGNLYTVGGITSYNGTTTGYLIRTSIPLVSETWYKQNIDSITFDGATTAYQINTSGITGTTAALAYYFNQGLTSGDTYVFSYFIDTTRGFTGFNARIINWTASDAIGSAPSLTTTSGITFTQILPVTGSPSYLQTPIQYDVGSSGWVKVAFQFNAPSSSPRLGLHVYHAGNNNPQGYTAYIKDVYLNHQQNGRTAFLTFIGNKNKNQSVEYYYNGLTQGTTYIFSYYVDLSRSYTGPNAIQTFNHFQEPTYYLPIGITYNQILPAVRNNLYHTAGMSYGSSTGWTKISYSFNVPIGNTYDPIHRNTLSVSVLKSSASVLDSNDILNGTCHYIAEPTLEIENFPSNISIPVSPINYESITRWNFGPCIGWVDGVKGPNRRYNVYLVNRGGNSAYFGEIVRHACLSGTAKFGLYNPEEYVDYGITGTIAASSDAVRYNLYRASGLTTHITSFLHLDSILKDVHEKIGGFTTATADVSRPNWLAPYIASGAPDTKGITWWWRVTALPGHTVYCNGFTLSFNGTAGAWVGTTGPSLETIGITSTKWNPKTLYSEPNIESPTKEINFAGMTNTNQFSASGFSFNRGSTASYVGSNGQILYASPNQPRFTHDINTLEPLGLLLETGNTNLLNWSESFGNSGGSHNNWIDTRLQRTVGSTAPSGLTTAIRFTATGANAILLSSQAVGSSSLRTFSIFVKGITGTESIDYTLDGGTSWTPINGSTFYYFAAGPAGRPGSGLTYTTPQPSQTIPTTWKRYVFEPTTANHLVGIRLGNTGDSVELWGAQLETRSILSYRQKPYALSYIPTESTRISTTEDSCIMSGASFSSWYNPTYGSFVVEARNIINGYVLYLEKDASNYFRLLLNNFWASPQSSINGVASTPLVQPKLFNQEITKDTDYKLMLTYSPFGMKYGSWNVYDFQYYNIRSTNWPGNTVGPPEVNKFSFQTNTTNESLTISKLRYWPFVFDENTMKEMGKSNVDFTTGIFGGWENY